VESQLADPDIYADKDKFQSLDSRYKSLGSQVESKTKEYEKLFEQLMELEEKIGS
jgi:ATP-binding cassette subfamily F protein 3